MNLKKTYKCNETGNLQEVQRKLACFEDDILPFLPSKEAILARAKQRQLKKKTFGASILSVLGLSISLYWYNPVYQQFDAFTVKGQQDQLSLKDGSLIRLNSNTQIQVSERLRSREIVLKQGEASFRVAHSASAWQKLFERSFIVTAGKMDIIDIGTVFNVQKHNATDATVAVEEGEVAVKIHGSQNAMIHLLHGQTLSNYREQLGQIRQADLYAIQAWQSGELVLNQMPLGTVIENFQRYADFEVQIQQPELAQLQVTGQFKTKNYQQFMQVLPAIAAVKVEQIAEKQWIIKKN